MAGFYTNLTGGPIYALVAAVDRLDLARKRQVCAPAFAHRTLAPGIKSASGDLQQSAHHPHRVGGPGSLGRTRRALRGNVLGGEPGRGFREDLPLLLELAVLSP
jgi:hypothetical protein